MLFTVSDRFLIEPLSLCFVSGVALEEDFELVASVRALLMVDAVPSK